MALPFERNEEMYADPACQECGGSGRAHDIDEDSGASYWGICGCTGDDDTPWSDVLCDGLSDAAFAMRAAA